MPGVFVTRGGRFDIPPFEIGVDAEGRPVAGPMTLNLTHDVYPLWLEVAVEQAELSAFSAAVVDEAWQGESEDKKASAIDSELKAGMQSIVAAAIAFEAFHATLTDVAPVPSELIALWSHNRLSRPKRMAAVLQRSFTVGNQPLRGCRKFLCELFPYRDDAVHPNASARPAVTHPRLDTGFHPRILMFRAQNALTVARNSVSIISGLLRVPRKKFPKLVEHCEFARETVDPIAEAWVERHGPFGEDRD